MSILEDQEDLWLEVVLQVMVQGPIGTEDQVASVQDSHQSIATTLAITDLFALLSSGCQKDSTMSFESVEKSIPIAVPPVRACSSTKAKFVFHVFGLLSGVPSAWHLVYSL